MCSDSLDFFAMHHSILPQGVMDVNKDGTLADDELAIKYDTNFPTLYPNLPESLQVWGFACM